MNKIITGCHSTNIEARKSYDNMSHIVLYYVSLNGRNLIKIFYDLHFEVQIDEMYICRGKLTELHGASVLICKIVILLVESLGYAKFQ